MKPSFKFLTVFLFIMVNTQTLFAENIWKEENEKSNHTSIAVGGYETLPILKNEVSITSGEIKKMMWHVWPSNTELKIKTASFSIGAPIEIGNYIWEDTNNDGIQDACEPGIPNVNIALYDDSGGLVASTTTDAAGEYYFSGDGAVNQAWVTPGDSLVANSNYYIVAGTGGQFSANELSVGADTYALTVDSSLSLENRYAIDSDGEIMAITPGNAFDNFPATLVLTGDNGSINHDIDFGFRITNTILAQDDDFSASPIIETAGGTTVSVFLNNGAGTDDADGSPATDALIDDNINITNDGGLTGATINTDGTIAVPPGTTAGTYNVEYQICLAANNTVCDMAIATIVIDACTFKNTPYTIIKN